MILEVLPVSSVCWLRLSVCLFFLDCSGLAEYRGVFPFPIISRQNTLPKLPKTVKSLSAFWRWLYCFCEILLFCPQCLTLQRSLRRSGSAASSRGISPSTLQWCPGSSRTATSSGPREACSAAPWSLRCRLSSQKGHSPSEFALASRYTEACTEFWFYFWWQITVFEWATSISSLLCCVLSTTLTVKVIKEKNPCKIKASGKVLGFPVSSESCLLTVYITLGRNFGDYADISVRS